MGSSQGSKHNAIPTLLQPLVQIQLDLSGTETVTLCFSHLPRNLKYPCVLETAFISEDYLLLSFCLSDFCLLFFKKHVLTFNHKSS